MEEFLKLSRAAFLNPHGEAYDAFCIVHRDEDLLKNSALELSSYFYLIMGGVKRDFLEEMQDYLNQLLNSNFKYI